MKYFLDTEFLEGSQKTFFSKSKPTIDLISIGIVDENKREYYAISRDFNINEAWNRFDFKYNTGMGDANNLPPTKVYWIRENVLKPIWQELKTRYLRDTDYISNSHQYTRLIYTRFTLNALKGLIGIYGKSNEIIADEIKTFVGTEQTIGNWNEIKDNWVVDFYGYYSDYDWVAFCWLFGTMVKLPKGFPMYCKDLKQMLDDKADFELPNQPKNERVDVLKNSSKYPKQSNEHNALSDAKWNLELFKFIRCVS